MKLAYLLVNEGGREVLFNKSRWRIFETREAVWKAAIQAGWPEHDPFLGAITSNEELPVGYAKIYRCGDINLTVIAVEVEG